MSGKDGDIAARRRQDRLIQENTHDTYMTRSKPVEPTVCPRCGVVFSAGRWQWQSSPPADAREGLCPACQRIRDKVPAGFLILSGGFFAEHRDEIMRLVHNKVDEQSARHPMKRIMDVEERDEDVVISFTDMHLPNGVGNAIERAYEGDLDLHYTEEAGTMRAYWKR